MNSQIVNANKNVASFDFIENGKIITDAPKCYLSLLKAGSMRFRWKEKNQNRENFIQTIQNQNGKIFVPVELNHTKDVFDVKNADDTNEKVGDGIITTNKNLIPCVTVADCVPIYFFDRKSGVFGIVRSGWKGTGIIEKALLLANKNYNSLPSDFSVVIGPHINECCYIVNEERALYFTKNFGNECVVPLEADGSCYCGGRGLPITWNNGGGNLYRLSLSKANLFVLKKLGVKDENIFVSKDCTCCDELYGSNRRQTAFGQEFCVQIAYIVNEL